MMKGFVLSVIEETVDFIRRAWFVYKSWMQRKEDVCCLAQILLSSSHKRFVGEEASSFDRGKWEGCGVCGSDRIAFLRVSSIAMSRTPIFQPSTYHARVTSSLKTHQILSWRPLTREQSRLAHRRPLEPSSSTMAHTQ